MAALTKSRPRSERGSSPGTSFTYWPDLPVKGAVKIYVGSLCGMLNGVLSPVIRDAAFRVMGVYTGNPAYPGGNASDPNVEVIDSTGLANGVKRLAFLKRGIFEFDIDANDPVTKADIGLMVYALDDNTIAKTDGLADNLSPKAGRLYDVLNGKAHVLIGEPIP